MPVFNPFTGEVLAGVAGMQPSVEGVSKGPAGSTSPSVWYDTDNIIHQVSGVISKTNIRTNVTVALGGPANELAGGCKGKYLAWSGTGGLTGEITLALGGLNRVSTDARGAAASDGSLAYIPVRLNPGPTVIRSPKGAEVQLADMYGLHILKWGQAVWNSPTTAGALEFWGTTCAYIPGALNAKLVKIGGELWIVYYLGGDVIAHKAISPTVYHTVTSGFAYHMDAIAFSGKLAVCYSSTTGEAIGDITKEMDVIGTKPTTAVPPTIVAGGAKVGPTIPDEPITVPTEKIAPFPQFADLKTILSQSKQTDNALYQTAEIMIERLDQFKGVTVKSLEQGKRETQAAAKNADNSATPGATYITKEDDRLVLPNSVQLLAGAGITFDDSVPNKRTISSSGGGSSHYDCPLSDGDVDEASLIYASGECIIVQVPV